MNEKFLDLDSNRGIAVPSRLGSVFQNRRGPMRSEAEIESKIQSDDRAAEQ
jgi:hypothetical protein